jgi:hypothetical protein
MAYSSTKEITSTSILSKISEIEILEYYLGIKVELNSLFCSPIREDKKPGCKFYYNGSKIKYVDYAEGLNEDCFGVVKVLYNLNYNEALIKVCKDFDILNAKTRIFSDRVPTKILNSSEVSLTRDRDIKFQARKYNKEDLNNWKKYKISKSILITYNVRPAEYIFIDNRLVYRYTIKDPAYIYEFPDGTVKVYFMLRDKNKFLNNSKYIQGINVLPSYSKTLIITKSLKDVMVLRYLGINAIAPQSEAAHIKDSLIEPLLKRFENVYLLYDNDEAGIKHSNNISEKYEDLLQIFIPKDKGKDISDFIFDHTENSVREWLKEIL